MERIFTRDVGGFITGEIRELDWDAIRNSLAQHHGITDPLDSYSLPVDEAARRYVATITPREAAKSRRVPAP
jgi:hypothetical protein